MGRVTVGMPRVAASRSAQATLSALVGSAREGAGGRGGAGLPVADALVLRSVLVFVGDGGIVLPGRRGAEALARPPRAHVVGRAVDVDDELRARGHAGRMRSVAAPE